MNPVQADLDTDRGPPLAVPLRHFVVALGFLVAAGAAGVLASVGALPGRVTLAFRHLFLVGWVCVTILGAMTQFVPVWAGVTLYSQRLAARQLWLVTAGLALLVAGFLGAPTLAYPVAGVLLVAGFWTFVYNVGRSLAGVEGAPDVTETHFALALGFFALVPVLGAIAAADLAWGVLGPLGVARSDLVAGHATLAVFGAIVTTVLGALYQLSRMFTQTDADRVDRVLRRAETALYPAGVVVLAAGRLIASPVLGALGAGAVLVGLAAFAVVFARTLARARTETTPVLRRYGVAALALVAWLGTTAAAWTADPLAPRHLLGHASLGAPLAFALVAFVVLGTVYHVVPFIVWVHRYSDRVGLEPVPMVDDLYDDRLARVDLAATTGGFLVLVGAAAADAAGVAVPPAVRPAGNALLLLGFVVFAANVGGVLRSHAPYSLRGVLLDAGRETAEK